MIFPLCSSVAARLKDPASYNGHYHNIEVVTYINYESFGKFKNEACRAFRNVYAVQRTYR